MYTIESKNQLAKLMATENITIEHRNVSTACFDLKNRVLTCPIWKEMSGDLYDLLMGHEIGHATETPAEGWHNSVSNKGTNYKHFLNVIEDTRIEKKVKRRYPGLKRSFISAYNQLLDKDFFGIDKYGLDKLSLIDKINIHFKCGVKTGIVFNDIEMEYVKQVESCETWNDVVAITNKLFDYCKEEQQKQREENQTLQYSQEFSDEGDYEDYEDYEESEGENEENENQQGQGQDQGQEQDDDADSDAEDAGNGEDDTEENEGQTEYSFDEKESKEGFGQPFDFEPECKTDKHFREKEHSLLDESCLPYVYLSMPKVNLKHIITPQKRVQELLDESFKSYDRKKELAEFKRKNENYVGLLAKEFEMRKSANCYAKRKISNSGDIDVNKVYQYQLEESIFRKITKIPNGKSHGLVLLLDCSGSMYSNMSGAIEQIMVLAMFCRRVNIPFVVYGFGNNINSWVFDYPGSEKRQSFIPNKNTFVFNNVSLREYLNSDMGNAAFTNALANLATLKKCHEQSRYLLPIQEQLSNTPLTEAMVALKSVVEDFRKKRNLDIVNMAIVHDGDADKCSHYVSPDEQWAYIDKNSNFFIVDKEKKVNVKIDVDNHGYNSVRIAVFDWFTKVTGVKIFGFFIVSNSTHKIRDAICRYYYVGDKTFSKHVAPKNEWSAKKAEATIAKQKEFSAKKLLVSENPGYEKFFLILGGKDLITDGNELDVEEGASIRKLKTAFAKKYSKRKVNRILVNQFIEGIAV